MTLSKAEYDELRAEFDKMNCEFDELRRDLPPLIKAGRDENERLRAVAHAANGAFLAFAKAPPELADDHELMQAMSTLGAALDSYDTLRESS
jgi:hypothetical protein